MKPGQTVYLCFSTDFLVDDADEWRFECWQMIRERSDLRFLFLTKRIERFMDCIPKDWNDGYDNVTVGCTVEKMYDWDISRMRSVKSPMAHMNRLSSRAVGKPFRRFWRADRLL